MPSWQDLLIALFGLGMARLARDEGRAGRARPDRPPRRAGRSRRADRSVDDRSVDDRGWRGDLTRLRRWE